MRSKRAAPRLQGTKKKQTRPPEFKRKLLMTVCPSVHFETCMVVVILHARKVIPQRLAASSPPSPARWVLPVPDPFTPPPRPSRPRPQPRRSQAPPPPSWDLSAEFGPLRPSLPLLGPLPPNLQKGLTALQRPQPPPPRHRFLRADASRASPSLDRSCPLPSALAGSRGILAHLTTPSQLPALCSFSASPAAPSELSCDPPAILARFCRLLPPRQAEAKLRGLSSAPP